MSKLYLCLPQITPELQDGLLPEPVETRGGTWYAASAEKALSQAFPGRVRDFCHERKMVSNFWAPMLRRALPLRYLDLSRIDGSVLNRGQVVQFRNSCLPGLESMAQLPNEDLFESTKMTFGEHLEELRVCLVRALSGLAVGFLIGLAFAAPVVRQIEVPLRSALEKFYFDKSMDELKAQFGDDVPVDVQSFMRTRDLVYEESFWEVADLKRILEQVEANPDISPKDSASGDQPQQVSVISDPGPPTSVFVKARVWKPLEAEITSLSAHEPFMIWLKAALITGAVISSPWVFWQIWAFIASGLYPHEKGHIYLFVPFSLGLFLAGAALAFFFVFEPVLEFLFSFNKYMQIDPDPRISEWMSFVLFLPLGFGISFQLPLVMLLLDRIGVMSVALYLEKWRIAVLVIFVVAMVLTPADPISMLLMACPLTFLYFGGVALCKWLPKRQSPFGEGYDPS